MPLRIPEGDAGVAPFHVPGLPVPGEPEVKNALPFPISPRSSDLRITWQGKNVSLEEVLNEICRQAKLRWKLGPNGVVFTPAPSPKRHRR